jgi:PEP-CTERM motif/Thioester domain
MRRCFSRLGGLRFGLTMGLLAILAGEANADLTVNNIGLYDGTSNAPTAYISFTGSGGSIDVYADAQTATNWTFSNGASIPLYCIDLIHENVVGDTYNVKPETNPTFSTTPGFTDAANRVAWAIETAGSTADDRGATQLLIWSIVDNSFSVTNWSGNTTMQTEYNTLVTEMGNSSSGYNSRVNYLSGAEFLGAQHDSTNTLYQDLALAVPGGIQITALAPEPSTLMIAGLGALGMIGYGCRRRARFLACYLRRASLDPDRELSGSADVF